MEYKNITIEEFINVTAGKDPVPGGGSVSALAGTLAAALGKMVTGLTIGRKKYADVQPDMEALAPEFDNAISMLLQAIADDAAAYDTVFNAYKLPKETDEEKAVRKAAIQEALTHAARVPLSVAERCVSIMPYIKEVSEKGNQNAITDSCVAMMCARTGALGAILNCRINLSSITDADVAGELASRCDHLQQKANEMEQSLLNSVKI